MLVQEQMIFKYKMYVNPYNSNYLFLKMEETQAKPINLTLQLQNITNLESRIQNTKKQLSHLLKIEDHQTKDIQNIMKMTFMTTKNKVNLYENHQLTHRKQTMQSAEVSKKKEMVREMREKEERQLKQIKEQMKKNKENERLLIRNSSLKYEQMIKINRQHQLQKKEQMIKDIKAEKDRYKQELEKSKQENRKKKENDILNQTMVKLDMQPSLKKQLQALVRKKEEAQSRVIEKKNVKSKVMGEISDLKQLGSEQFVNVLKSAQISPKKLLKDDKFQLNPALIEMLHQKSKEFAIDRYSK